MNKPTEARPLRVVVIAGNYEQAQRYRRRAGLSPREFIYANHISLRGLGWISSVVRVGTWRSRRDLDQIGEDISIITAHMGGAPPTIDIE